MEFLKDILSSRFILTLILVVTLCWAFLGGKDIAPIKEVVMFMLGAYTVGKATQWQPNNSNQEQPTNKKGV